MLRLRLSLTLAKRVILNDRLCENSDGVQGMMSKFYLNRAKHDCDFSFCSFRYLIFD